MEKESRQRKSLGRGLNALLGPEEESMEKDAGTVVSIGIKELVPGKYQPRRNFSEADLDSLVASLKEKGVLQPILVRPLKKGKIPYEIVAGERRWKAAQVAGLEEVPVLIKKFTDQQALEAALIENIQRENLSAIEEAEGYQRLFDEFKYTQEALSQAVGKSRSHVANMVRLLDLPDFVKKLVDEKALSAGHARALLPSKDPEALARHVIQKDLNVRQVERLAKTFPLEDQKKKLPKKAEVSSEGSRDSNFLSHAKEPSTALEEWKQLEEVLEGSTGLPVQFVENDARLYMVIELKTMEKFDRLLANLTQPEAANSSTEKVSHAKVL